MVPIIGMKAIARYKIYNLQKSSHIKNERMKDISYDKTADKFKTSSYDKKDLSEI